MCNINKTVFYDALMFVMWNCKHEFICIIWAKDTKLFLFNVESKFDQEKKLWGGFSNNTTMYEGSMTRFEISHHLLGHFIALSHKLSTEHLTLQQPHNNEEIN
jgi:hypothetical protein